jgi:hypothetical protein
MQDADVVVRQHHEQWMLLRDGALRGTFSTRDAAIAEGRALVQVDRTTLWLQNDHGLREIGSYRIARRDRAFR